MANELGIIKVSANVDGKKLEVTFTGMNNEHYQIIVDAIIKIAETE